MDTYLPRRRITLALSWYLQSNWKIPVNKSFTPVSAKIRAIISRRPAPVCCIAAIAVAVVFCKMLGSNTWPACATPERFCITESKYSSIGNDCAAVAGTVKACTAPGVFMRTTPLGATVSRSSMFTWPSIAVIRGILVRYILSRIWRVIVDLINWMSILRSAKLCPKNLWGIGIGQILANGMWSTSSLSRISDPA